MVSVDAGTLLLGADRRLSRRLVAVALGFCLLASAAGSIGHVVEPTVRAVTAYVSLALVPVFTLVAVGAAYRNQGLVVCWLLTFAPLYGAIVGGFVGLTGDYPTLGEWLLFGVQFGGPMALAVGTAAFFVGFAGRLVADWYGGRAPQST